MTNFGMKFGPLRYMDEVGLGRIAGVMKALANSEAGYDSLPEVLESMVKKGMTGHHPLEPRIQPVGTRQRARVLWRRANYKKAGIKEWKPSVMRHTFASNHLANFGNLDGLLQAMGHRSSPQTLRRYYHKARTKSEATKFW